MPGARPPVFFFQKELKENNWSVTVRASCIRLLLELKGIICWSFSRDCNERVLEVHNDSRRICWWWLNLKCFEFVLRFSKSRQNNSCQFVACEHLYHILRIELSLCLHNSFFFLPFLELNADLTWYYESIFLILAVTLE